MTNFTRIILSILIVITGLSSTGCTVIGYQKGKGLNYDNWEECNLEKSSDNSKYESGAYIRIITIHGKVVEGEIIEFQTHKHITIFKSKLKRGGDYYNPTKIPWSDIKSTYIFTSYNDYRKLGFAIGFLADILGITIFRIFLEGISGLGAA